MRRPSWSAASSCDFLSLKALAQTQTWQPTSPSATAVSECRPEPAGFVTRLVWRVADGCLSAAGLFHVGLFWIELISLCFLSNSSVFSSRFCAGTLLTVGPINAA